MENKTALNALSALAHDTRLAIFRHLVQVGPGGTSVGDIREAIAIPGPTLSAHLNILRQADLVVDAREGRVIRIRANYDRMNALLAYLFENCCSKSDSGAAAIACCPPSRSESKRKSNASS